MSGQNSSDWEDLLRAGFSVHNRILHRESGLCTLEELVIPSGIVGIDSGCFRGSPVLRSVTLPETLTELGASAFEDCAALEEILIPAEKDLFRLQGAPQDYAPSQCYQHRGMGVPGLHGAGTGCSSGQCDRDLCGGLPGLPRAYDTGAKGQRRGALCKAVRDPVPGSETRLILL